MDQVNTDSDQPLLPVRRLHNYAYCPRLFYLQWVEGVFVENADTVRGSSTHKRVDEPSLSREDALSSLGGKLRSIELSSELLHLVGVVDLLEVADDSKLRVVDYKKGSPWRDNQGQYCAKSYDAIQMAAYTLLLREAGHDVTSAGIYYAQAKKHVEVALTSELLDNCQSMIAEALRLASSARCPKPLDGSGRCIYCSAYPICLPYESKYWTDDSNCKLQEALRPPMPQHDQGEILVVQNNQAYVTLRGGNIRVLIKGEEISKHPIKQLQSLYLYGAVQVSAQAMHTMMEQDVSISYFSPAGRFLGLSHGLPSTGVDARIGQVHLWENPTARLKLASELIRCKIHNQRVNLMRNGQAEAQHLKQLALLRDSCSNQKHLDSLRGVEGAAAAIYFAHFTSMIKSDLPAFHLKGRNRRPPKDPVNAMLSLGYSILSKEITGIAYSVGLDPYLGFFHSPRYGRPALALDMMEEFRPLIVDSVVLSLINRGEIAEDDFIYTTRGCLMRDSARRQFWRAWTRRMDTEVSHPAFGYRMSYRRMMEVQMRQFWRLCRGDVSIYRGFTTR